MTRRLCHADERKGETAVHGCHCPSDMAVRMREVLARPWVGVCVPLALSLSRLLVYLTVLGYACAYTFGSSGLAARDRAYTNLFLIRALAPRRSLRHGVGTHGWVALLCQPWGRYFNLETGCLKSIKRCRC